MQTEYLLPCSCGRKLTIGRSQAGLSARCECGQDVAIPTLRGLDSLERATGAAAPAEREWTGRQALLFLGSVITAVALAVVGRLWMVRPVHPDVAYDMIIESAGTLEELEGMTPVQSFELWKQLNLPPEEAVPPEYTAVIDNLTKNYASYQRYMGSALAGLAVGAVLLLIGFLMPKRRRSAVDARR